MITLNMAIRKVVESVGDPLMEHIWKGIETNHPALWNKDQIYNEVMAMVQREELRMKEDSVDHDWSYRKGRNW